MDITACTGDNCPLKDQCYRYTCKKDKIQYYFDIPPYETDQKECKYFCNNEGR